MQLEEASVLLVDDEPGLLDVMRELFEEFAGQVFCAGNGRDALQVLAARQIDLVITDIRMPGMDGIQLLKRIKADKSYTAKVIFITGFAEIKCRDVYDLGAEALLEKPIEWNGFLERVRRSVLDPGERWGKKTDLAASPTLRRSFRSLSSALQEHQIAFGSGGFCLENCEPLDGAVNIDLVFTADEYVLLGQGLIRWNEEHQVGVEITYLDRPCLARGVRLTRAASAFIPRTTGTKGRALALAG